MNRDTLVTRRRASFPYLLALLALTATMGLSRSAQAQWATNGNDINTTNSGNVGIGTTTPGYGLEVNKTNASGGTGWAALFRETGKNGILLGSRGSGNATGAISGVLADLSSIADLSLNPFGGNVGVGTLTPTQRLHIAGNNTNWGGYPILKIQNTQTNGHSWWLYSGANGVAGSFGLYDETAGSYRMFFDASGGVGVGTTSPAAYGSGRLVVQGAGGTDYTAADFVVQNSAAPSKSLRLWYDNTNNVGRISAVDYATAHKNLILNGENGGGNVGIGSTAAASKLTVTDTGAGPVNVLRLSSADSSSATSEARMVFDQAGNWYQGVSGKFNGGSPFLGFSVNSAANTWAERMRIDSAGNVGIGTTAPAYRLDVSGGQVNASEGLCIAGDCKTSWSQITGSSQWATSGTTISYSSGNVGIGTSTPAAKLDVNGNANVTGDINATGNITGGYIEAKYQDVAEWVPANHELSAGTVVVLNPEESNQVIASSQAYDTRVAGVVSARPGLALGEAGKDKVLVATTGRVKVKVDATRSPIRVGDLLVTSDKEGLAMKSEPVELGGVKLHRPGTLVGKALEPLEKGTGEILVLLSLQ